MLSSIYDMLRPWHLTLHPPVRLAQKPEKRFEQEGAMVISYRTHRSCHEGMFGAFWAPIQVKVFTRHVNIFQRWTKSIDTFYLINGKTIKACPFHYTKLWAPSRPFATVVRACVLHVFAEFYCSETRAQVCRQIWPCRFFRQWLLWCRAESNRSNIKCSSCLESFEERQLSSVVCPDSCCCLYWWSKAA